MCRKQVRHYSAVLGNYSKKEVSKEVYKIELFIKVLKSHLENFTLWSTLFFTLFSTCSSRSIESKIITHPQNELSFTFISFSIIWKWLHKVIWSSKDWKQRWEVVSWNNLYHLRLVCLLNPSFWLYIDVENKSIRGCTELCVVPHGRGLKNIRLNCRQCEIDSVFVNDVF